MTPPMHSDYSIASTDERVMTSMDEVSLSSRSMAKSVVSKLSRLTNPNGKSSSLTSTNNSDMASSLLLPMSERDEGEGNDGHDALIRGDNNGGVVIIPNNSSTAAAPTTKSYISEDDPFHIFRSDLTHKLINVSSALNAYLTIVDTSDTSMNINKVRECKRILKTSIKLAEETLIDLETTIRVVDKRRIDFGHIDDAEMYERRHFINGGKDELARTRVRMQGDDVRKKLSNDERKHRLRSSLERQQRQQQQQQQQQQQKQRQVDDRNGNISNNGYNYTDDNDNNSNNNDNNDNNDNHERTETMLIMQRQDETLHDLDMAVTRVSYMADTIHTEIESQNVMLNKLEDELIDAEEQLGVVMGKLAKLLKTKNKCQLGLILMLSLVVLVLFFLVLYT